MIEILISLIYLGLIYFFLFSLLKSFYLGTKESEFECMRCGKCCKYYKVKPKKADIERIKKRVIEKRSLWMENI